MELCTGFRRDQPLPGQRSMRRVGAASSLVKASEIPPPDVIPTVSVRDQPPAV